MNDIYQETVCAVEAGARIKVDFQTRSLKVDGKCVIRNGSYEGDLGVPNCGEEEFFSKVEELYRRFKHSIPSERSESASCRYFTALPESELSDEDMLYGCRRDKAQIELELYILCQIINGLKWNSETMGSWFWQGKTDKDLVILKQWVEPSCNLTTNNTKNEQQEERDESFVPAMRNGVCHHGQGKDGRGNCYRKRFRTGHRVSEGCQARRAAPAGKETAQDRERTNRGTPCRRCGRK